MTVSQLKFATMAGGANKPSLLEAQQNFANFGASEERFTESVRAPLPDERRDALWRPLETRDIRPGEQEREIPYPRDYTELYYWRRTDAACPPAPLEKKKFLVCYDYGMGGVWCIFAARSPAEVNRKYPMLIVKEDRPGWMTEEDYARIERNRSFDIDDPPTGWLLTMLKEQ